MKIESNHLNVRRAMLKIYLINICIFLPIFLNDKQRLTKTVPSAYFYYLSNS